MDPVPSNPAARGPWPVGARRVTIAGLHTEIWYPAAAGSEAGRQPKIYDLRQALPASERAKITDENNPLQVCDCFDQLPIDDSRDPYPVVIFIHGFASWRAQSLSLMTHWASRGFIVVSSDHPGLRMADLLGLACGQPPALPRLSDDTDEVLAALAEPDAELAFLDGRVDTSRVAITGHSVGGSAAARQAGKPNVRAVIAMGSSLPIVRRARLESALFLGAIPDQLIPYRFTRFAYHLSPPPKRLVGLKCIGHLAFSDVCQIANAKGQSMVEIARDAGVCGVGLGEFLVDCDPTQLDVTTTRMIVNYSTTALLEQALRCVDGPDPFADLQACFPDVVEYRHAP